MSPEIWLLHLDTSPPSVLSEGQPRRPQSWPPCSKELLCAGGQDDREPPSDRGFQLILVWAEHPHVQHWAVSCPGCSQPPHLWGSWSPSPTGPGRWWLARPLHPSFCCDLDCHQVLDLDCQHAGTPSLRRCCSWHTSSGRTDGAPGHCPWSPSTAGPTWSPCTVIPSTSSLASNTFSSLNFSPASGRPGLPRDALVHLLLEGLHALAGGFGGSGPVELLPSFGQQLSQRLGGLGQDHFEWLPQGSPSRSPWSPPVSFLIASLVFRVSDSMVLYLLLASWPHLRTFFFFNIFVHFFVFG